MEPRCNEPLYTHREVLVITNYVKYMEKNLDIVRLRYREHILAVPWPFVKSRFQCVYVFIFNSQSLLSDQLHASHAGTDCLTSNTNNEPKKKTTMITRKRRIRCHTKY